MTTPRNPSILPPDAPGYLPVGQDRYTVSPRRETGQWCVGNNSTHPPDLRIRHFDGTREECETWVRERTSKAA